MNIVDIVILAVLGISVIYGFYRGFVSTVLSMGCCLAALLLAFTFGPRLAVALRSNEGISSTLATYTDAVARVGDYDLASANVDGLDQGLISRVLGSVELPDSIAGILQSNLENKSYAGTGIETVNDYVSNTLVGVVVNALCYVACFLLSYLLLSILISLISHVFKLPLLKQLDWLAGGVFGLARGCVLLYVLFLLLPVVSTVVPLGDFNQVLQQSTLAAIFESDGFFARVIAGVL